MTVAPEKLARISVEQYHRMIDSGILHESDRIELLDGFMVHKMPNNPLHAGTLQLLFALLSKLLPAGMMHLRAQLPITLSLSEPEPDIALVSGKEIDYLQRHPAAHEVHLMIELSDPSLKHDQTTKKEIHAEAGIAQYWIVNLQQKVVELYTQPSGPQAKPTYLGQHNYSRTDHLPVVIEGRQLGQIAVADFLV